MLAAALSLLAIALTLWFFKQSDDYAAARKQSFTVINNAENFLSALKDAETGQRGYLLTGDEAFLTPYLEVRGRVTEDLKSLRQVSSSVAAQTHLDALVPLVDGKLSELARSIELRRSNNEAAAVSLVKSGQGKQLMDAIRKEIADFNQIQDATLTQNDAGFHSNMRHLFTLIVATSLFSILYAFFSAYLFYRQTQQRAERLIHRKTKDLLKTQELSNQQLHQSNVYLQNSEEDFHALVLASTHVVWKAEGNGYIEASPSWCEFTGQSPEQMVGRGWLNALHPDERGQVLQAWEQAIATQNPLLSEHRARRNDGEYRYCVLHGVPVLRADGSLRNWIGTLKDITERRVAEDELRESEHRLHLATEATGVGVWEWNVITNRIKWDDQLFRIYGITPTQDQMVDYSTWKNALLPEDLPLAEEVLHDTAKRAGQSTRVFRILRADNKACRTIQAVETARLNAQGQVEWVMGTNLDITDRKEAEKALSASEIRYRRLFEAAEDGVLLLDPVTRKITDANPFMTKLLGYSHEQLVGKELFEIGLLKDESASREMFEKLTIEHHVRYDNLPLENKDGRHQEVEVVANLYDEDHQPVIQCNIRDITVRKLAEDTLRENEERYRALVEATATAVWRTTPEGEVVFASDTWNHITGQTEAEKSGWGWMDAIHPDDREHTLKLWSHSLETRTVHENEFRVCTQNGGYRWFSIRGVPICNKDGGVREWIGANTDIHDRKQALEELGQSRARLRYAANAARLTYVEMDFAHGRVRAAENFQDVMGFHVPPDEDIGSASGPKILLDHIHVYDRPQVEAALRIFFSGESVGTINYRVIGDDQVERWIESTWAVRLGSEGKPLQVCATNLDITGRRQSETALRQSQARLALGMEVVGLSLAEIDYVTGFYHLSAEAARLFGLGEAAVAVPRAVVHATFHPDDRAELLERIATAISPTGTGWFSMDHRVVWPNGEVRWLRVRKQVFFEGEGRERRAVRALIAALDVTEQAEAEATLLKNNLDLKVAKAIAEKANVAKSDFLSSMSHELRTPLGAMLGFAQLIESSEPPPTPGQKRSIDQILHAGWYLLDLINQILDLSVVESGNLSLSLEPVSLAGVIHECRDMIEPQANERGISVTFAKLDQAYWVNADHTRVKQIIVNLLSNAIKYNKVSGTVDVDCKQKSPGVIRINVRDTGAGLSEEQLAQLFQPFNRLGREAGNEQGTGIGLVVSKQLVELMGGRIGVESHVGTGSVFWIELDLVDEPHSAPHVASPAPLTDTEVQSSAHAPTLLYVEDNAANLQLVESILARKSNIRLLSAKNGNRGIEIARNVKPTVILLDINLPGMNGFKVMKILAQDPATATIPVIALSASAMRHDIEKGLKAGFFSYLTKPIKINEFMETVEAAVQCANAKSSPANSEEIS